jgi:hypothetical protein
MLMGWAFAKLFIMIPLAPIILFMAWVLMMFWGAFGNQFDFFTISYGQALLFTIAITLLRL